MAYRKLKSPEVAEELVQGLFAGLWSKRAGSQIQQLDHYLFAAIRYRVINHIKLREVKAGYEFYCRGCLSATTTATEETLALTDLSTTLTAGLYQTV